LAPEKVEAIIKRVHENLAQLKEDKIPTLKLLILFAQL